jgi:hypothetical protein
MIGKNIDTEFQRFQDLTSDYRKKHSELSTVFESYEDVVLKYTSLIDMIKKLPEKYDIISEEERVKLNIEQQELMKKYEILNNKILNLQNQVDITSPAPLTTVVNQSSPPSQPSNQIETNQLSISEPYQPFSVNVASPTDPPVISMDMVVPSNSSTDTLNPSIESPIITKIKRKVIKPKYIITDNVKDTCQPLTKPTTDYILTEKNPAKNKRVLIKNKSNYPTI